MGQVEYAEVRKPKYGNGSEKKKRLLVPSALLTHECAFNSTEIFL